MIALAMLAAVLVFVFLFTGLMGIGKGLMPNAGILGLLWMLGAIVLSWRAGAAVFGWIQ